MAVKVFKKKGLSYKKLKLIPGGDNSPDAETQKAYADFLQKIYKECLDSNGNKVMLFLDGKHQLYNVKNGYCWQIKGKSGTQLINSNTGRRRLNILGALDPISLEVTSVLTESNCNKEFIMLFFLELRKKYPKNINIYLILDNASYNRCYEVQEFADDLGIELIYLPPYCPNLSLIERFWKFFIKKTVTNTYYDSYKKFFKSISNFLGNIGDYVEDLKSLITMNFEIIKET